MWQTHPVEQGDVDVKVLLLILSLSDRRGTFTLPVPESPFMCDCCSWGAAAPHTDTSGNGFFLFVRSWQRETLCGQKRWHALFRLVCRILLMPLLQKLDCDWLRCSPLFFPSLPWRKSTILAVLFSLMRKQAFSINSARASPWYFTKCRCCNHQFCRVMPVMTSYSVQLVLFHVLFVNVWGFSFYVSRYGYSVIFYWS